MARLIGVHAVELIDAAVDKLAEIGVVAPQLLQSHPCFFGIQAVMRVIREILSVLFAVGFQQALIVLLTDPAGDRRYGTADKGRRSDTGNHV